MCCQVMKSVMKSVMKRKADQVDAVFMFCVGATKAGTSWLHDQLRNHPDCRLRTIKEYHYFNLKEPHHWENRLAELQAEMDDLSALPDAEQSHFRRERLADLRAWQPVIAARQIDVARYRDFHLAQLGTGQVVGDLTPAYALMPGKDLSVLATVARDVRVIYLIRDPLARLWSHLRMAASRAFPDNFDAAAKDLLTRTLAGQTEGGIQGILRRGDYRSILPKLRRLFDPAKLLVMFTEDLMTPSGFARMLDFLGLRPMQAQFDQPVHQGRALAFPAPQRRAALQVLRPQYDFIASEFPALPDLWQRNLNEATQ